MNAKIYGGISSLFPCAGVTAGALWLLTSVPAGAQFLTPAQQSYFSGKVGDRVEAATILGGDYGIGGGAYNSSGNNNSSVNLNVSKFGGMGDIYPIRPLGDLGIGWQPQLQGSMGYLTATKSYHNLINGGDSSENKTFAIQFGGGARFWFDDHFSIAPTVMGMYGHSENDYTAVSPFGLANQAEASREGLINWSADTWTIRPSVNVQYQFTWQRTIITLSSRTHLFPHRELSTVPGHRRSSPATRRCGRIKLTWTIRWAWNYGVMNCARAAISAGPICLAAFRAD